MMKREDATREHLPGCVEKRYAFSANGGVRIEWECVPGCSVAAPRPQEGEVLRVTREDLQALKEAHFDAVRSYRATPEMRERLLSLVVRAEAALLAPTPEQ